MCLLYTQVPLPAPNLGWVSHLRSQGQQYLPMWVHLTQKLGCLTLPNTQIFLPVPEKHVADKLSLIMGDTGKTIPW